MSTSTNSKLDVNVRLVTDATDNEIQKAITVLGEAFQWHFFNDELDGDDSLVPELLGAYTKAGLVGGQVYFAENLLDGDIIGVAIWFGPGQKSLGTPGQRAAGWDPLMARLSPKCRSWWDYFLRLLYDDFVEETLGAGVLLRAFHLQLIGIHPGYQRKGIGRKMLEVVQERAREANTICVLETFPEERATTVYEPLGYTIRGRSRQIHDVKEQDTFYFYVLTKE
ncbi:hypothetical protein C8R43DRAFT_1133570 [Mycena crocata]|nr:hypothetical protein C8R43DRAFT_1133570 [Mycena crocata]